MWWIHTVVLIQYVHKLFFPLSPLHLKYFLHRWSKSKCFVFFCQWIALFHLQLNIKWHHHHHHHVVLVARISLTLSLLCTHLPYHNDSIIVKTDARRKIGAWRITQEWRTHEDFFRKIFTSNFIARVWKGCWRFACERVLETEHKLHILTPLLWPSRCVFLVLLMLGSTPSGLSEGPLGLV